MTAGPPSLCSRCSIRWTSAAPAGLRLAPGGSPAIPGMEGPHSMDTACSWLSEGPLERPRVVFELRVLLVGEPGTAAVIPEHTLVAKLLAGLVLPTSKAPEAVSACRDSPTATPGVSCCCCIRPAGPAAAGPRGLMSPPDPPEPIPAPATPAAAACGELKVLYAALGVEIGGSRGPLGLFPVPGGPYPMGIPPTCCCCCCM